MAECKEFTEEEVAKVSNFKKKHYSQANAMFHLQLYNWQGHFALIDVWMVVLSFFSAAW